LFTPMPDLICFLLFFPVLLNEKVPPPNVFFEKYHRTGLTVLFFWCQLFFLFPRQNPPFFSIPSFGSLVTPMEFYSLAFPHIFRSSRFCCVEWTFGILLINPFFFSLLLQSVQPFQNWTPPIVTLYCFFFFIPHLLNFPPFKCYKQCFFFLKRFTLDPLSSIFWTPMAIGPIFPVSSLIYFPD